MEYQSQIISRTASSEIEGVKVDYLITQEVGMPVSSIRATFEYKKTQLGALTFENPGRFNASFDHNDNLSVATKISLLKTVLDEMDQVFKEPILAPVSELTE